MLKSCRIFAMPRRTSEKCDGAWENQVFFHFWRKLGFSGTVISIKEKNRMQKTNLYYLKQMWFYLHLANLILVWNSTKSAPLNGHYPKLQFPTYTWFPHAQSQISISKGWATDPTVEDSMIYTSPCAMLCSTALRSTGTEVYLSSHLKQTIRFNTSCTW